MEIYGYSRMFYLCMNMSILYSWIHAWTLIWITIVQWIPACSIISGTQQYPYGYPLKRMDIHNVDIYMDPSTREILLSLLTSPISCLRSKLSYPDKMREKEIIINIHTFRKKTRNDSCCRFFFQYLLKTTAHRSSPLKEQSTLIPYRYVYYNLSVACC